MTTTKTTTPRKSADKKAAPLVAKTPAKVRVPVVKEPVMTVEELLAQTSKEMEEKFGMPTQSVATMPELLGARENSAYHRHFVGGWNSGAGSRDYEYYCRHMRQSMGLNHYFVTRNFILRNPESGFGDAVAFLANAGYQILFASEQVAWVMKVVNNIPYFYGEIGVRDKVLQVTMEGDQRWVKKVIKDMEVLFPDEGLETKTLHGFGQQGPMEKTQYLYPKEIPLAKTHFYPWLEERGQTLEEFFDEYMESRDPILLLIGSPGTGKSTLLRTMLLHFKRKGNFMCSDSKVLLHDSFTSWLIDRPDNSFIAVEDADTLIESRERGNTSMSGILNSTQGIIPNKTKVVISTNLPTISSVDQALTRVGRTHDIIEFGMLTANQVNVIREIEGLPALDLKHNQEYSLAEALAVKKERKGKAPTRKPQGIGFH